MPRNAQQYRTLLQNLLPRGRAWTRSNESDMALLLYGLGEELSRIEGRIEDLLRESRILTTNELISDYENEYGLPDPYREIASTLQVRIEDVLAKMLSVGGQNETYYQGIALTLGYIITQEFFNPAVCGFFSCGDACGSSDVIFYWLVQVSVSGNKGAFDWSFDSESIRSKRANDITYLQTMIRQYISLFAEINRLKPAHVMPLFNWYDRAFSSSFGWAFDCFPSYDGTVIPEGFDHSFSIDFANTKDYDGKYLIGSFDTAFSLDYDTHNGWDFYKREFDESFARPL